MSTSGVKGWEVNRRNTVVTTPDASPAKAEVVARAGSGTLEQAESACSPMRWILHEQGLPSEPDCIGGQRRLDAVAPQEPSSLVIELDEPLHPAIPRMAITVEVG